MAGSLSSSLLTATAVDASAPKAGKNNGGASNSGESAGFSRVLDDQRAAGASGVSGAASDTNSKKDSDTAKGTGGPRADRASKAEDSGGNTLPPQGQDSADENDSSHISSVPNAEADGGKNSPAGLTDTEQTRGFAIAPSASANTSPTKTSAGAAAVMDSAATEPGGTRNPLSGGAFDNPAALQRQEAESQIASTVATDGPQGASNAVFARALGGASKESGALPPSSVREAALASESFNGQGPKTAATPMLGGGEGPGKSALGSEVAAALDASAPNRNKTDWMRSTLAPDGMALRAAGEISADTATESVRAPAGVRGDGAAGASPTAGVASLSPSLSANGSSVPGGAVSSSATAVPEYALTQAPDDGQFPGEVTARMKTLVRDGVREAKLQLHPAELGRLQVTISTEGDQTKVAFTAESSAARDAIEQSMPRLREMLEQSGLQLAQSDVDQRDSSDPEAGDGDRRAESAVPGATEEEPVTVLASAVPRSQIDTYI